MSLLLDAQKKSQQAQASQGNNGNPSALELSLEEVHDSIAHKDGRHKEHARSAGQNLFDAKVQTPSQARAGINRNLLIALGGVVLLLAAGAGYVWYAVSADSQPVQLAMRPAPRPGTPIAQPAPATSIQPQANQIENSSPAQNLPAPNLATRPKQYARATVAKSSSRLRKKTPVRIEQHRDEPIDPILNDAYHAYLAGNNDHAQQLYLKAHKLDARNTDALLGLAAIAQRRGADSLAVDYYAQVLELDPRDAVANAGMSALTAGVNNESRLKTLLNGQPDSSALHFALGNHYAKLSRWAEAQQSYFNAYKLAPQSATLSFNLAISLDRLGQKKPAAQYYLRAMELDSNNSAGFNHTQLSQRIEELNN